MAKKKEDAVIPQKPRKNEKKAAAEVPVQIVEEPVKEEETVTVEVFKEEKAAEPAKVEKKEEHKMFIPKEIPRSMFGYSWNGMTTD